MRLATIALLTSLGVFLAKAADLTTRDGTVYRNYHVVSSDPGYLTILYVDGGGRIPLANLPPDLQRQYHYDPVQAAAYIKQFEAEDHEQLAAVQSAEAASPSISVPAADSASQPPVNTTRQVWGSAPRTDETAPASSDFDPGPDPLAPGGDVLSQSASSTDSSSSQELDDDGDYYAGYDSSGGLWVSSFDAYGRTHWYRWDRRGDERKGDLWRVEGNRDLPADALITLDRAGRWVVTYVDDHGHAQRFYRSSHASQADTKTGAWRVVVNNDGSRSLRPQGEEHQSPPHFTHYAYIDHRTVRPGEEYPYYGNGHHAYAPDVSGGSVAAGDNVHPGSIPTPTGSRPTASPGYSGGSGAAHGVVGGTSTVRPAPVATPASITGH